jgi:F0F1-type ATP synthase delta subunit
MQRTNLVRLREIESAYIKCAKQLAAAEEQLRTLREDFRATKKMFEDERANVNTLITSNQKGSEDRIRLQKSLTKIEADFGKVRNALGDIRINEILGK